MPAGTAHVKYRNDDSNEETYPSFDYTYVPCYPRNNTKDFAGYTAHSSGQSHCVIPQPRSDFQSH